MDAHEQLAAQSTVFAGVLGRATDFLLVRLDKDYPSKQADIECALSRGLVYCGALGWSRDTGMAFALEPNPETFQPLSLAVVSFGMLVGRLTARSAAAAAPGAAEHGDSIAWLHRLRELQDPRD